MIVSQLGLDVGAIVAAPAIVAAKIGVIRHIVVTGSRVGIWMTCRAVARIRLFVKRTASQLIRAGRRARSAASRRPAWPLARDRCG